MIDFATRSEYGISSTDLPALVRTRDPSACSPMPLCRASASARCVTAAAACGLDSVSVPRHHAPATDRQARGAVRRETHPSARCCRVTAAHGPRRLRHCDARQSLRRTQRSASQLMLQPQLSLAALHRAGWMRFAQAVRVHPSNALGDGDAAGAGMPRARFDSTHAHRRSCVRCRTGWLDRCVR